MSFRDLPENWPGIALSDPAHIANVLDIFVSMKARAQGAIMVLVCDDKGCPLQPIMIEDVAKNPEPDSVQLLRPMAETIAQARDGCQGLFAIARTGSVLPRSSDHAWRRVIEEAFSPSLGILGIHVITPHGSRDLREEVAA
jgi:hypothetical protein